ncbi:MAG: hypothetical protein IJS65_04925, partial [Clostridia bacterium]|nr:hypothetical protein [Clostridia bacterium]
SVYGKDDFAMLQDINAVCIGDFVAAVELFNKVNGTKYDTIRTPTETVVFDSRQIKSATDNVGAFDRNNPDTYYSRQLTFDDLAEENNEIRRKLIETQKALKEATRRAEKAEGQLKRTETPTARASDVKKLTASLLSEYSSKADKTELTAKIQDLADYIVHLGDDEEGIIWETVKDKACDAARAIIENAAELTNGEDQELYAAVKDYLKKNRISITNVEASDIADFELWKKDHPQIRVGIQNGGVHIDQAYQDLAERAPWLFSDDATTASDQLLAIAEALDTLRPVFENPYSAYTAEAIEELSNEIIDNVTSDVVRQTAPTFADKAAKDKALAVSRTAEKYKARVEAAIQREMATKRDKKEIRHGHNFRAVFCLINLYLLYLQSVSSVLVGWGLFLGVSFFSYC